MVFSEVVARYMLFRQDDDFEVGGLEVPYDHFNDSFRDRRFGRIEAVRL